jgi:His/Glu/Gln/Arg/opine family amino acid ABC transporter permease subunit
MDYTFQWAAVWKVWPDLAHGAIITAELTVFSMVLALAIGIPLALSRTSKFVILRAFSRWWVEIARNTPALLQVYLAYFGLGAFGIHLDAWWGVLAAVTFNSAGYLTEILRGGLQAVNKQQRGAALSLGMTPWQAYVYVILPQVLRLVFLPVMNQVVWALLATSLGMMIGLNDLAGETAIQQSLTFRPFEFYAVTAVIYYAIAKVVILTAHGLAHRLFRY